MVTFRVSDVEPATTRPATIAASERLAALGWKKNEAQRIGADRLIDGPLVHPLAFAIDLAFREHRPLVLTPDAVWLCLAQGLATHVELHAEQLRPRLVRHNGQLDLDVRRDDFVRGGDNDWPAAIDTLTAQIRTHIGGRADLFVADFSTTGPLERTASQLALMGAMRQYFRYSVSSLCGIPEITLAGTALDWASIRRRAAAFGEFDLGWWLEVLEPVLAKLEDTARGTIDLAFWRRLYKQDHESGGDRSCGWLNALFPYVGDPLQRSEFPDHDAGGFEGHLLSDYPTGRTRVPFTWKYYDQELAMELVGGLWGASVDERGAIAVAAGWVVAEARGDSGFIRSNDRSLAPRAGFEPETLESLCHEPSAGTEKLWMYRAPKLRSLAGIERMHELVEVSISDAPRLESIAALSGMTHLKHLDLRDCHALANLAPVFATLPQLETLCLMGNRQLPLADFLPIANMTQLSYLVLWHCVALPEPLRCMHQGLEAVAQVRAAIAALA